ncbi:MAG: hypothetical protein FJX57_05840, partial [Alphaproteobacteria bacterium]|nr:hypothetical protein [Alphaproteobacteria bacterium]
MSEVMEEVAPDPRCGSAGLATLRARMQGAGFARVPLAVRPAGVRRSGEVEIGHRSGSATMKIVAIRVRRVTGTMQTDGPFWEERLMRPIDIYPEHRADPAREGGQQIDASRYRLVHHFLQIDSDAGVHGIAGPVWPDAARLILTQLKPRLMGRDPLATELIWDQLHRLQVHGRQGDPMIALSAVDCALWDLKARFLGQPLWRLLGGPTRDAIPAYASMLGFAVQDLGLVRDRALAHKALGFP